MIGDWNILIPLLATLENVKKEIKFDRMKGKVFPKSELVFNAFAQCPYDKLKVVIIKQTTYADDYNDGLAFSQTSYSQANSSSNKFIDIMDKQLTEYGSFPFPENELSHLAKQGVLLLNRELTTGDTRKHTFWIPFTNEVVKLIQQNKPDVFFIIFGADDLLPIITNRYWHFPTMTDYEQSDCYVKINEYLKEPIKWV
jgi:uracil-DNA glycosylase